MASTTPPMFPQAATSRNMASMGQGAEGEEQNQKTMATGVEHIMPFVELFANHYRSWLMCLPLPCPLQTEGSCRVGLSEYSLSEGSGLDCL